jgi:hypothetical protein
MQAAAAASQLPLAALLNRGCAIRGADYILFSWCDSLINGVANGADLYEREE